MNGSDPSDLRALAERIRREADHLVLVRMRVARDMSEVVGETAADARVESVHETWTREQYPALGAASRSLRRLSVELGEAAEELERERGRRLGGYGSAGYLGAGTVPAARVRDVAEGLGARSGARIGGFPFESSAPMRPDPHASYVLGAPTPAEPEDED